MSSGPYRVTKPTLDIMPSVLALVANARAMHNHGQMMAADSCRTHHKSTYLDFKFPFRTLWVAAVGREAY